MPSPDHLLNSIHIMLSTFNYPYVSHILLPKLVLLSSTEVVYLNFTLSNYDDMVVEKIH